MIALAITRWLNDRFPHDRWWVASDGEVFGQMKQHLLQAWIKDGFFYYIISVDYVHGGVFEKDRSGRFRLGDPDFFGILKGVLSPFCAGAYYLDEVQDVLERQ